MILTRLYNFRVGDVSDPDAVDSEFDQILDLLNGKLGDDNIQDGGISPSKLNVRLASDKFRGHVKVFDDLKIKFPDATLGDVASTDDLTQYMFNGTDWVKIGGTVSAQDHNTLTNRNVQDAHSISSITNLQNELSRIENLANDTTVLDSHSQTISNHANRIATLETNQKALNTKSSSNETNIVDLRRRTSAIESNQTAFQSLVNSNSSKIQTLEDKSHSHSNLQLLDRIKFKNRYNEQGQYAGILPYWEYTNERDELMTRERTDEFYSSKDHNHDGRYAVRIGDYNVSLQITDTNNINVFKDGTYIGGIRLDYKA